MPVTTPVPDRLLSRVEAAEYIGLRPQTLAHWASMGIHLPFVRVGRLVKYRRTDLDAFLQRNTVPVVTEDGE